MPTCSQAKIITNLESGINKRLFKFVNEHQQQQQQQVKDDDLANNSSSDLIDGDSPNKENYKRQQQLKGEENVVLKINRKHDCLNTMRFNYLNANQTGYRLATRRVSVDDSPTSGESVQVLQLHKVPIVFGDFMGKRESVPINFLYNSPFKSLKAPNPWLTVNSQLKMGAHLRSHLNLKIGGNHNGNGSNSDSEEFEPLSQSSSSECSDDKNSSASSPVNKRLGRFESFTRKSFECFGAKSKRNSLVDETAAAPRHYKQNSLTFGNLSRLVSNIPKLALEVESMSNDMETVNSYRFAKDNQSVKDQQSDENDLEEMTLSEMKKKITIDQAKRLLALASIRPSKTFHKAMTDEEIEVLKKYYEIIKPKVSIASAGGSQNDPEKEKYENSAPLVYNTAKINSISLINLKSFIESYKKDIDSGLYLIDYDQTNEPKGFVLKNQTDESVIKIPDELNDAFFALAVTSMDKENKPLGEANLFRIVNWNDATFQNNASKQTSKKAKSLNDPNVLSSSSTLPFIFSNAHGSSNSSSPNSSTLSFEYIKNLSNLVNSILEPKLIKQLSYTGIDIGVLPGSINFDMPSFEELGINLESLLSKYNTSNGVSELPLINSNNSEYQSCKLKNSAYKKLKEKVAKSKVMWFSSAPQRKPLSVIFEYAGVDMGHETILQETNNYLASVGGSVTSVEFVPRSVLLNSVYVDNLWVLTLSDANTKFHTITNGIQIKDQKISVKSYDEFIFAEYERFVKTEKYKQLIKNHEKAIINTRKSKKIN